MLLNFSKIAFRQFWKNKSFSLINIIGLAIGMAACLLLFIVVRYELSYDRFLQDSDKVYAIASENVYEDGTTYSAGVPEPALHALRLEFPQLTVGALYAYYGAQVSIRDFQKQDSIGANFIESSGVYFADSEWFDVFAYKWLMGDAQILKEPGKVAITKAMAEKYFGDWKTAIGHQLQFNNYMNVEVAGILENVPANTDFDLKILASMPTARAYPQQFNFFGDKNSSTSNFRIYTKIPASENLLSIKTQLKEFAEKFYGESVRKAQFQILIPLEELHYDDRVESLGSNKISKATLLTLSLVGLFILAMACINFINLSTAQAINRSKEIGIRKVLGSNRRGLFFQIMGETAVLVLISLLLALLLTWLCLPLLKQVTFITETLPVITTATVLFALLLLFIVTLLAGIYPALIISGYKPLLALKNRSSTASVAGISLRRILVVLQFSISQILIIGTLVAITQMSFIEKADLGFKKESILTINTNVDSTVLARQKALKQEWLAMPEVEAVSFCNDVPSSDGFWSMNFAFDHRPDEKFHVFLKYADPEYFDVFGLEFLAGKPYPASDTTNGVVINETLMRKLGYTDATAILDKDIRTGVGRWQKIVGVTRDFNTSSLRDAVKPLMIRADKNYLFTAAVKIKSKNLSGSRDAIMSKWDQMYPRYAGLPSFFDERIEAFYQQEQRLSMLYRIFSVIAVFISCLGLYGLIAFIASQRKREVGIRKVLGASVSNILLLFSKEFVLLVFIAFIIAAPIAWFLMNNWLSNFTYRIHMGIGVFAASILLSLFFALIAVGYKSLRAATSNPVNNIRE